MLRAVERESRGGCGALCRPPAGGQSPGSGDEAPREVGQVLKPVPWFSERLFSSFYNLYVYIYISYARVLASLNVISDKEMALMFRIDVFSIKLTQSFCIPPYMQQ